MSAIDSIIEDIVTEATEIVDIINTRSSSLETPSSIVTRSNSSETLSSTVASTSIKMADDKKALLNKEIERLEDEKSEINKQIEEIEKSKEIDTGKTVILRSLRAKKLSIGRELRIALELKDEGEYERKLKEKQKEKEDKRNEEIDKIFKASEDTLKPTTATISSFNRNLNMIGKYKEAIKSIRQEIKDLMTLDITTMTPEAIENRNTLIQAKSGAIKTFTKEYEKHHHELIMNGEENTIKILLENFQQVMEITNGLDAIIKQEEENKKKQLALAKTESLEAVKIEKFSGQGDNKYLRYYIWYTEFSELVLKKEYTDSIKLKFLKQYTEKDAHELVKNYHHPQELKTAFKTLDDHYGKPSMVIRESLRNLRLMEVVKSINDIKANRALLSKINTNISTLKCYNFELEGDDVENSSFLIEIEEKVPHIVYTKWEEEKVRLKSEEEDITINGFIQFYTNLVNIEEKAQYVRKQTKPDDKSYQPRNPGKHLNLHHASIKPIGQNNRGKDHGGQNQRNNNSNRSRWNIQGNFQGHMNGNQNKPYGVNSVPRYCIFCETNTHDTGFCKIAKYTAEYKTQQCQKHNACYMCFKTSEHKANTCPKIMKCLLCPRMHHFNNHARKEIDEYYKKKKQKANRQ